MSRDPTSTVFHDRHEKSSSRQSEGRGCPYHIHTITQWLQSVWEGRAPCQWHVSCRQSPVTFITVDSTSECPCANERAGSWLPGISTLRCRRDPCCPVLTTSVQGILSILLTSCLLGVHLVFGRMLKSRFILGSCLMGNE